MFSSTLLIPHTCLLPVMMRLKQTLIHDLLVARAMRRALITHLPLLCLIMSANASSAGVSSVTRSLDDMPGCICPVPSCLTHETAWMTNPFPCSYRDNANIPVELDISSSICDAIEQSSSFWEEEQQQGYEDEEGSEQVQEADDVFASGQEREGAQVATFGGYGTCHNALSVECHDVHSLNLQLSTMSAIDPFYCGGTFYPSPSILKETSLSIYMTCQAHRTQDAEENNLEVYIEAGDESDAFFSFQQDYDAIICDDKIATSIISPALTSADWIEPNKGRRYMCHDLKTPAGDKFFILFLNIGNEPCSSGTLPDPEDAKRDVSLWRKFVTPHRIIIATIIILSIVAVNRYYASITKFDVSDHKVSDLDGNLDDILNVNANVNLNMNVNADADANESSKL